MTRKTMETKREAFGDAEAARELAQDVASMPEHDVDQPNNAPTLPADEEPKPEEHDDDEQESPDGRWVQAHGCWLYE